MTNDITRRNFTGSMLLGTGAGLLAINIPSLVQAKSITATIDGARNMPKIALLLIDVQNDYFQGGKFPLDGMELAAQQSVKLLAAFRAHKMPVFHVRHADPSADAPFFVINSKGAEIHPSVTPQEGEPVIVKQFPNSFRDTNLKKLLDDKGIDTLIITGAMSNMCVDAGTRAAADFGYNCAVAHDACAAMEINFNGVKVPAAQVHAAFMGALGLGYAKVATAAELLKEFKLS
jgi:nicotinamidase-related amidase